MSEEKTHVLFASFGNDSIALIQWMAEHGYSGALRATRGVKTDAAKALGIGRRTLYDKLREHEIQPEEYGR